MKVVDGRIQIDYEELLDDETILRALAKHALFEPLLIEALTKWLIADQISWSDEQESPWYILTSGPGSVLENARKALLPLVSEIVRNENARVCMERDRAVSCKDKTLSRCFELERIVTDAYSLGYSQGKEGGEMLWPRGEKDIADELKRKRRGRVE